MPHYPDAHCTGDTEETDETGHEDHPHGEGSITTERVNSTEETPLDYHWETITEKDSEKGPDHRKTITPDRQRIEHENISAG